MCIYIYIYIHTYTYGIYIDIRGLAGVARRARPPDSAELEDLGVHQVREVGRVACVCIHIYI